jgi:hypothetical protein
MSASSKSADQRHTPRTGRHQGPYEDYSLGLNQELAGEPRRILGTSPRGEPNRDYLVGWVAVRAVGRQPVST